MCIVMRLPVVIFIGCILACVSFPTRSLCSTYHFRVAHEAEQRDTEASYHWTLCSQDVSVERDTKTDAKFIHSVKFTNEHSENTRTTQCVDCTHIRDTTTSSSVNYGILGQVDSQCLVSKVLPSQSLDKHTTCFFPFTQGTDGKCTCASGYIMLFDASCVSRGTYDKVVAAAKGATTIFRPLNINNEGISGPSITSRVVQHYSIDSAVRCVQGDTVACNFLANMCVLMMYEKNSLPCRLCHSLLSDQTLVHHHLPHIYYNSENFSVDMTVWKTIRAGDVLRFIVSVYDWRGNWKGFQNVSSVFNLCHISSTHMKTFFRVGSGRKLQCFLDWKMLMFNVAPTDFFEVFVLDPTNASRLVPVPLVMDYTSRDFQQLGTLNGYVQNITTDSYRRRFYVYDNIASCNVGFQSQRPNKCYLTALRHASFVFDMSDSLKNRPSWVPIIFLQYASKLHNVNAILTDKSMVDSAPGGLSVVYLIGNESVNKNMMITMIILCILCILSAWIRTFGWMRRRQNMILGIGAIIRFLVYLCNHIGNMFALVVSLASWYIFAVYRTQEGMLGFLVGDRYVYIEAMLYTATVAKGIIVLYKVVEQCNADYFVIDWERSKGQLLRENRILPVSMWRSTFVANELSELQTLRHWRPLLSMTIILFLVVAMDFLKYTQSVPVISAVDEAGVYSVTALRIAMGTFFWFTVCLVLNIIEFHIYYRFFCVHPLQAFVDLCSVSNISILILPELQWGYYIHGESIHAYSDISMEEFQHNLYLESQGNLPVRGLGGQSKCQTFEVFMGIYTRQYLYMCHAELEAELQRSLGKVTRPIRPGRRWHFFECIFGGFRNLRVYSSETLMIKKRVNYALQESVRSAEGTLLMKFSLHRLFDIAPNILYMNGPQSGDKAGKDLFFADDVHAYGNAFLYGLDLDLFVLYAMLYASVDALLHNVWTALAITFAVEILIRWYRMSEGLANLSAKTLIDKRFFL